MPAVLAIDQGTSGTKAMVVDPDAGVLSSATRPVRPRYGDDGAVEIDARRILGSVVEAGREAVSRAGVPVSAVGLANQGETVLAWDRATGTPLTDAVVWQDRRAAGICDAMRADAPGLLRLTGLPLDPYFAAPKMAWLRRERTRQGVVTTVDAWLTHQLTGEFVTDASTASRTMLLDIDAMEWSEAALAAFGLSGEPVPRIVDCAGTVGTTDVFGARLPVTGLVVDQQAALWSQGCRDAGQAKCTYGTGAFLLANVGGADRHGTAPRSAAGLPVSVAWQLAGTPTYCVDGQVYTVASALRWLSDLGVMPRASDLDTFAGSVPDSGGVRFLPAFAGLGAPHWRPQATATVSGLALGTTAAHLVRAALDGIAAMVAELVRTVGAEFGRPLSTLRVDGGLSRSRILMQTQADLAQVPVEVSEDADATGLGVASFAMLGAGMEGGPALTARTREVFHPSVSPEDAERTREAVAALTEVR